MIVNTSHTLIWKIGSPVLRDLVLLALVKIVKAQLPRDRLSNALVNSSLMVMVSGMFSDYRRIAYIRNAGLI